MHKVSLLAAGILQYRQNTEDVCELALASSTLKVVVSS